MDVFGEDISGFVALDEILKGVGNRYPIDCNVMCSLFVGSLRPSSI